MKRLTRDEKLILAEASRIKKRLQESAKISERERMLRDYFIVSVMSSEIDESELPDVPDIDYPDSFGDFAADTIMDLVYNLMHGESFSGINEEGHRVMNFKEMKAKVDAFFAQHYYPNILADHYEESVFEEMDY